MKMRFWLGLSNRLQVISNPTSIAKMTPVRCDAGVVFVQDAKALMAYDTSVLPREGAKHMGKLIVSEFISLDGIMEAPETWHFPYISDDMAAHIEREINATDVMLYGRVTYEAFAGFWPTDEAKGESIAEKLNSAPKYVVSTTLASADWKNSTLIKSNVIDAIARLKQETQGTIGITGSATLVRALTQADLIDEFQLLVHPIVVGKGKHLFDGMSATVPLKLTGTKTFASGVVLLTYQPAEKA